MKPVERNEIVDYQTYADERDAFRQTVLAEKALRRVHVGPNLTFLFENRTTVRYQVQEMMRVEQIVREAEIAHELATYNELLGGDGELGCTLLIEIDGEAERAQKLSAWLDMPRHLYALLDNGERVHFTFDPRQLGDARLSSVQYLKLKTGGLVPVAIGCDLADYRVESTLTAATRDALRADLGGRN